MSDNGQHSGGFKAPGNPAIPQDLALIMEMVAEQNGDAEPTGTASEARAALEKSGAAPTATAGATSVKVETEIDSDSESSVASSEDVDGMIEEDSDAESDAGVTTSAPMSAGTHAHLLSQLTSFVHGSSSAGGQAQNMADSDDEDFILSEPLATEHEVPLPTVVAPPIEKVPAQEKRVLAGSVMSWMPAKGVAEWLKTKEEEAGAEPAASREVSEVCGSQTEGQAQPQAPAAPAQSAVQETAEPTSEDTPSEVDTKQTSPLKSDKGKGKAVTGTKFPSSGTVVIRAIHNPQASAGDGWLEEGSLLCWEDGRVLGTVSETFGPLTSPFYQVRVAPPPFPFPSAESLEPGTKLYYPHTSQYRSFVPVRMLQTDPRFKGSDASNRYDEEVGEDEMEWSDDEMEAAAKRGKKQRKGKHARAGSATPSASGGGFQHPLPPRPHFDHEGGDDEPLMYDEMDAGSDWGGSEAGSNAGGRARPAPYEVDDAGVLSEAAPGRGQEDRRGRGRGGKTSRGRGGGVGAGSSRLQRHERQTQPQPPRPASSHALPPNPLANQAIAPVESQQSIHLRLEQQQLLHQQQQEQFRLQQIQMQANQAPQNTQQLQMQQQLLRNHQQLQLAHQQQAQQQFQSHAQSQAQPQAQQRAHMQAQQQAQQRYQQPLAANQYQLPHPQQGIETVDATLTPVRRQMQMAHQQMQQQQYQQQQQQHQMAILQMQQQYYNSQQGGYGFAPMMQQPQYQQPHMPGHGQPGQQQTVAPAINPRFAQYQYLMAGAQGLSGPQGESSSSGEAEDSQT